MKQKLSSPLFRFVLGVFLGSIIILGAVAAYLYSATPQFVLNAKSAHLHIRLQVLVEGNRVDFSQAQYQTDSVVDVCSEALTREPVHFHDNKDQILHIHWAAVRGGDVLKHYGWNLYGGLGGVLDGVHGFSLGTKELLIPIHGKSLPARPVDAQYYIYTGTAAEYKRRDLQDFLSKDLESFLANSSTTASADVSQSDNFLSGLIRSVGAHVTKSDPNKEPNPANEINQPPLPLAALQTQQSEEARRQATLEKANDFRGNVVIFVQKTEPTEEQIKARFEDLEPFTTSSCSA